MRIYFQAMPWFFAFFAAAITMRLWSEEKKLGTLELLLTMPIRSHEIVLGKYLAGLTILVLSLVLTFTVPITIALVGDPDWGRILTGYVGAFLAGAFFMSLGAFISATTENQIVALMLTSVTALLIMAVGIDSVVSEINDFFGGLGVGSFLAYFSVLNHADNMFRGILDLRDVIYFGSMTALALLLNYVAVESRKY
jgi:ABC-2 type transport system permease protein